MKEITCNIHIHSTFSDGSGTYTSISKAAVQAGLDVIILTDHNVWVNGYEGYYLHNGKQVLVLTGEEVHDQGRDPQKNHLLVLDAESEVATNAYDPQKLIDTVHSKGGICFLAHPDEMDLKLVHETDISWVNWEVSGYNGFELWNHMSEFKTRSRSISKMLENVFSPQRYAVGPLQATLDRWDNLLASGKHLNVIGGSDSHMLRYQLGSYTRWIFPYEFHFSCINNHLILAESLNGDLAHDKSLIYAALRQGSSFIGYDLPASTKGFTFTANDDDRIAWMGDSLNFSKGVILQAKLPGFARIRLVHNGKVIYQSDGMNRLSYPAQEPGAYRLEVYKEFLGRERGWIFSNPIYLV